MKANLIKTALVYPKEKQNKFVMKNLVLLFVLLTFLSSCSKDAILGSGDLITQSRDVEPFTKVSSKGVFEVTILHGESQSVEITADNNIMNHVRTRVSNKELLLYLDDDKNYRDITIYANITVTQLNGIRNSGAGNMNIIDLETDNFSIDNSGSADITIDGTATSLNVDNEGSGDIFGFDFLVDNCSVDIVGSGFLEIYCSDKLDVTIDGSGDVYYMGNPVIQSNIKGSGAVINSN